MGKLDNPRHEAFAQALFKGVPALRAYVDVGYSPSGAQGNSHRLSERDTIKARVAELQGETAKQAVFDQVKLLERFIGIATANPNELIQNRIGACRYCHGIGHQYQWRTRDEFHAVVAKWLQIPDEKKVYDAEPSDEGGYGYRRTLDPHPDCPGCDGFGEAYRVLQDTTKLSPQALALYAGVKETKDGIEIKTNDQHKALDQIGRIIGAFKEDNIQKGVTESAFILGFLDRINTAGSKLPFNRAASLPKEEPQT
jgi:phage terminase small subunit